MHPSFVRMKLQEGKKADPEFVKMLVERMQQLRQEYKFTQEYVIENTHLDISRYETGTSIPSLNSLLKLCRLYKITLEEFFEGIAYPPKESAK